MKKSIVFFILTIGWLIEGCYEDKGHYDYIRISGPEVTGIEKFSDSPQTHLIFLVY